MAKSDPFVLSEVEARSLGRVEFAQGKREAVTLSRLALGESRDQERQGDPEQHEAGDRTLLHQHVRPARMGQSGHTASFRRLS